jgi:DNA ligase (NAD+)
MDIQTIQQKLSLKRIWDDAYYAGRRLISDATYDANKSEIEAALKFLISDTSALVGVEYHNALSKMLEEFTATSFSKLENLGGDIKHDFPMMSLAKSNDINLFYKEVQKWKAAGAKWFILMWKIDGSSSAYRYRDLRLDQVLTRHTGEYGKDLTVTGYQIANLPKELPLEVLTVPHGQIPIGLQENAERNTKKRLRYEVRGEMVIREADFNLINKEREAKGLEPYQNARNAAAGVSQTKDADKIRELRLSMIAYDVLSKDVEFASHSEKLQWLKDHGFDVVGYSKLPIDTSIERLTAYFAARDAERFQLGYEVDGLVAIVDEMDVREKLGIKSNTPEYAFAFKFKDVEIEFEIDDSIYEDGVEWCFGSTGVITPRAHLKENPRSMEILGVSIRHSTLHNIAELKRVGWKKGSKLAIVKRAGLVIPKVVEIPPCDSQSEEYPAPPAKCPHCGEATGFKGEIYQCLNEDCEGKSFNRILRFIGSMEIDDIGESTLLKIVEDGLVKGPQDLYRLTVDQLINLERLGESSATKIVKNIQASRKQPTWRVMAGLMIRGLGNTTAKACSKKWPTLSEFLEQVNHNDLCSLDKVGNVVATNILQGVDRDEMRNIIAGLIFEGIGQTKEEVPAQIHGPLTEMSFCLTGSPELNGQKVKKAIVEKMITGAGGTIASMGKGLTYLVAGPDSIAEGSNKLEKAKKQGTLVITADELVQLIG